MLGDFVWGCDAFQALHSYGMLSPPCPPHECGGNRGGAGDRWDAQGDRLAGNRKGYPYGCCFMFCYLSPYHPFSFSYSSFSIGNLSMMVFCGNGMRYW